MVERPPSVRALWDEYYGLGEFEGVPIPGGIIELEKLYKNKWRKHYKSGQAISRRKKIVKGLLSMADSKETAVVDVIEEVEAVYRDECNGIAPFAKWFAEKGCVDTCRSRGRTQKP